MLFVCEGKSIVYHSYNYSRLDQGVTFYFPKYKKKIKIKQKHSLHGENNFIS